MPLSLLKEGMVVTAPRSQATTKSCRLPRLCTRLASSRPGSPVPALEKSLHRESLLDQRRLGKVTATGTLATVSQALRLFFFQRKQNLWGLSLQPHFIPLRIKPCFR